MLKIGFVLVTYREPLQIQFLCEKLSQHFDDPPIAIHHDYAQCNLDPTTLPSNVRIVQQWLKTRWGDISVVKAYLAALSLLMDFSSPDWCISLSSADYPVLPAIKIRTELGSSSADVLMDYREVSLSAKNPADARSPAASFQKPEWIALAYDRYVATRLTPYGLAEKLGFKDKAIQLRDPLSRWLFTPFSSRLRPFGGDPWHTINRKAAAVLLREDERSVRLTKHFSKRGIPEESYYHTILANESSLKIENNDRRYTDWTAGGHHPKWLGIEDVPNIVRSGAHFARKFSFDKDLLRKIDEALLNAADS